MLAWGTPLLAQLRISEFLANNVSGLRDEVNEHEDWIEVENTSAAPVILTGWYLTDDATRLRKWPFPGWTLGAGKRLVVFASGRDRRPAQSVSGQDNTGTAIQPRMATNFKISSNEGRYLALTKEAGAGVVTVVSAFDGYRKQVPDVSYGPTVNTLATVVPANGPVLAQVPSSAFLGTSWQGGAEPFADSTWTSGIQGVAATGTVPPLAAANLKLRLAAASAATLTEDSSGAAHHALNTSNTTIFMPSSKDTATVPMVRSGSLQFAAAAAAASSSQLTIPAHPDFDAASGTICFWMNSGATATAAGGSEAAILWDRRTTQGTVLALTAAANPNPGKLLSQPLGSDPLYSTTRVDDNQWHHVAFVYDQAAGGTDAFYIDGVPSGSVTHSAAWSWPASQAIELGRSHDSYWQKFNGLLDDVRFYDTALSAPQIARLFQGVDAGVESADAGLDLTAALAGNAGVYLRYAFALTNPAQVQTLRLTTRTSAGFIAWVNGVQVASHHAPLEPVWNSIATGPSHPGRLRRTDVPAANANLKTGLNILAIQALKEAPADPALLSLTTLETVSGDPAGNYLTTNTPGAANTAVRTTIGPFITDVTYEGGLALPPRPPGGVGSPDINISVKVTPSLRPLAAVSPVKLAWRVMYTPEVLIGMTPGVGGIYTAAIPTSTLMAGQMLRWRIIATDNTAVNGTSPPYLNATRWDQYYGTVAQDTIPTQLPVYRVFVSGTYAYNNSHVIDQDNVGGRASFFHDGELYDNVFIRIKGDTTRNLNKRAHRVDFNGDHQFRRAPGRSRLRELALNAEYVDPSYSRQMLSMWLHRVSGTGGPEHFPVRCQINGNFWQLAFHTETQDFELLDNMGLDPNGAMYASVGQMASAAGEKQTRIAESSADMQNFVNAITSTNATIRRNNVFDQIDLPAVVNYLAVARITQEGDDVWANMVIHRDSDNTGEWRIIPFDTNLSWGQLYYDDNQAFNSVIHAANDRNKSHPLYGNQACAVEYNPGTYNRFYDAIISVPETRAMLLQRMRSIMDRYLQPPGTVNPLIESMLDAHVARITPDAVLDRARWGRPSNGGPYGFGNQTFPDAITQFKNLFLTPRRTHLFTTHTSTVNVGITNARSAGIPAAPQPALVPITISSYEAFPAGSTTQNEEYLQLTNPNAFAADISGWSLSGGVGFTFKGGTVINAGGSLYVSPRQASFRLRTTSPKKGEARFVVGPYRGQLSSRGETVELRDSANNPVTSLTTAANPTPAQQFLRITELNYHPVDPSPGETAAISSVVADDFEYLELLNTGTAPLNLAGARFTKGIEYTFPAGTTLAAGARLLVAAHLPAFQLRYPGVATPAGPFLGSLDNGGEAIELVDASGEVVLDFSYNDTWYPVTDGRGRTLVVRDAAPSYSGYGFPTHWAISGAVSGSPGTGDANFSNTFPGWRWRSFTEAEVTLPDGNENPAIAGPDADPDQDGLSNFGEYAFGQDPRRAPAAPVVRTGFTTIGPDTYATATVALRQDAIDLVYDVQFTSNLAFWESATVQLGTPVLLRQGMQEVTWRDTMPMGTNRRFARVWARSYP